MRRMPINLRLVDRMLFGCLHVVATVIQPILHFDLVTYRQGICLGLLLFSLLAASIICSGVVSQATPLLSGSPPTQGQRA